METALQVLGHLHAKTLARSLAFIDLLEQPNLPRELDREIGSKGAYIGKHLDTDHSDQADSSKASLRALKAYSGKTKMRFAYARFDGKAVILGAGLQARGAELAKLVQDYERSVATKGKGKAAKDAKAALSLKSHREFVAEMTLSHPVLAAHYTKARERAQFALSLIRLRDKAQFTNESLAQRTGLGIDLVKKLTRGRLPKLETMRRLADALDAHIVIAPAGGIILEAHEAVEIPTKNFTTTPDPIRSPLPDPITVADLLLVQ
jgi:transcriptional regulator with XRE-family HTH domain